MFVIIRLKNHEVQLQDINTDNGELCKTEIPQEILENAFKSLNVKSKINDCHGVITWKLKYLYLSLII